MTIRTNERIRVYGSSLFQACDELFSRHPQCLRSTDWDWDDAGNNFVASPELHVTADDIVISIRRRGLGPNGVYEIFLSNEAGLMFWGKADRSGTLDESDDSPAWSGGVPVELVLLLDRAVAFPFLYKIYGLLDANNVVTTLLSVGGTADSEHALDAKLLFDVMLGQPIPPEIANFTAEDFWILEAEGRIIDLTDILIEDAEFWHLSIGDQGYNLWYPSKSRATAHPEIPSHAIYVNYDDPSEVNAQVTRPSLSEMRKLAATDIAVDATPRLKRTLAYAIKDYAQFERVIAEIDENDPS